MPGKRYPSGKASKKHQPKGLSILYEDHNILVVDKMAGLLSMGTEREKQRTAYYILTNYVKKGNERSKKRLFIVHRLDRDTSGILIFAKNAPTKRYLQHNWKEFSKKYLAVACGKFEDKEGVITSYLAENSSFRVFSVNNPKKGKLSKTGYKVIKESQKYSLLEIDLLTGRKNQIRVHLADKGHPVAGDKVYGIANKGIKRLALHSVSLTIKHPSTEEEMTFKTEIPGYFKTLLKI